MRQLLIAYGFLFVAIVAEIFGTTMLARSAQFTRLWPTLGMGVAYALSFYLLTLVLQTLPLAIAYALWGGLGIVLTTLVGSLVLKQPIDTAAGVGIFLILAGVVIINGWSSAATH